MTRLSHDLIYEAVLDDGAFESLPDALAQAAGARSALLHWRHRNGAAEVMAHSGYFTDSHMAEYVTRFAEHDVWMHAGVNSGKTNAMLNIDRMVGEEAFTASFFYNEFIRGMNDDTFRCMGAIFDTPFGTGAIGIHRPKGQAGFEDRNVSDLDRFTAAFGRLMTIRGELASARTQTMAARSSFDSLELAILQLDADGRWLDGNALGEEILRGDGPLHLSRGRVQARGDNGAFMRAVALATDRLAPEATLLNLGDEAAMSLSFTISPLRVPGVKPRAMVLIKPPFTAQADLDRRLMQLYGLSQAEARVSISLAEGLSPADIAERRQVSEGTVRIQLKTIMAKLGCRRQTQIAAAVLSLPPLRA